jgi:hypothetical protein
MFVIPQGKVLRTVGAIALLAAFAPPVVGDEGEARAQSDEQVPIGQRSLGEQIESHRQAIDRLQQEYMSFPRNYWPTNSAPWKRAKEIDAEVAEHNAELERLRKAMAEEESQLVDGQRTRELERLQAALAERDQHLEAMNTRLSEMERERETPPPENAEIKVFALKFVQAGQAAETIDSVFRGGNVRVATDNQANSLVVAGKAETLAVIEALLMKLDAQAHEAAESTTPAAADPDAEAPRSLLLRVYWLADGLPEGEGEPLANYLPIPVIEAMDGLGLDKPRIVGQIVNSLSRDANPGREAPFNTHVPAVIFKQPVQLTCSGKVWPIRNNTAELDVQISVAGNMVNTDLSGSLATPLGHFMVLGTANSVSAERGAFVPGMAGGEMGMEGMGRGGYGGRGMDGGRGGYAAPPGGFGGADPAAVADQPAEPKYNTSHFAFVVQVNEAESFADEK